MTISTSKLGTEMRRLSTMDFERAVVYTKDGVAVWRTKEKSLVLVTQMEQTHLENTIRKIQREANWRKHYLPALLAEAQRREFVRSNAAAERGLHTRIEYDGMSSLFETREGS